MNLEYPNECLLCLGAVPTEPPDTVFCVDPKSKVGNFSELCQVLKVVFPGDSPKFKKILADEGKKCCELLLCQDCYELVDKLGLLYGDIRRIERKIDYRIRLIQQKMTESEKGEVDEVKGVEVQGGSVENGTEPVSPETVEKPVKKKTVESSVAADYKSFVDTFRTLVKAVVTPEPEPVVLSEAAQELAEKMEELMSRPEPEPMSEDDEAPEEMEVLTEQDLQADESFLANFDHRPTKSVEEDPLFVPSPSSPTSVILACRFCKESQHCWTDYYAHRKIAHPEQSKALNISTFKNAGNLVRVCFVCGLCLAADEETSLLSFMEHMQSHEMNSFLEHLYGTNGTTDPKPFACDQCDFRFLLELNLDLHKICYHESTLYPLTCHECGDDSSDTWEDLVSHLTEAHQPDAIYSCKSCPMAFGDAKKLLEHMAVHQLSEFLPCSECDSKSPTLEHLQEHFSQSHGDRLHPPPDSPSPPPPVQSPDGSVRCPHCIEDKLFKNKTTLENHIRIHHDTTVTKHHCLKCGKGFVHRSTLRHHDEQVHLGIRYACPYPSCSKTFTAKSLVTSHAKLHDGEGPPVRICTKCNKTFASLTAFKTHIDTKHRNHPPVRCDICYKLFQNRYSLRGHKSTIHNIKPYGCPHCQQAFARIRSYHDHLLTHQKEGQEEVLISHGGDEEDDDDAMTEEDAGEGDFSIKIVSVGSVVGQLTAD